MTNRFMNEFIAARNGEREFPILPSDKEGRRQWRQARRWSLADALVKRIQFRIIGIELFSIVETMEEWNNLLSGRTIGHTVGDLHYAVFNSGEWVFNTSKIEGE